MSLLEKPTSDPLNPQGNVNVPAMELPSFRYLLAKERGTTANVLIVSPFALGDCVCAEPAIRYAAKNFTGCKVTLLTPFPDLFAHIENLEVLNQKLIKPDWDKFYVLKCYYGADEMQSEFTHNFNMAIGDYIATCLFKGNIPVEDRNIKLEPKEVGRIFPAQVVIHPGRHWVSKTFPKAYWDAMIAELILNRIQPVIIGADLDEGARGTVDINPQGCIDLRNKLSIMQSVQVVQTAAVVITNDSAPFHMACSGKAQIGMFSTVRHFDFTAHWRPEEKTLQNHFGYKQTNLATNSMWQKSDVSPMRNGAKYDVIDQPTLMSWLPKPEAVADWAAQFV